eukprot:g66.t1
MTSNAEQSVIDNAKARQNISNILSKGLLRKKGISVNLDWSFTNLESESSGTVETASSSKEKRTDGSKIISVRDTGDANIGRGVFANSTINGGTLLLRLRPAVSVVRDEFAANHCSLCFRKLLLSGEDDSSSSCASTTTLPSSCKDSNRCFQCEKCQKLFALCSTCNASDIREWHSKTECAWLSELLTENRQLRIPITPQTSTTQAKSLPLNTDLLRFLLRYSALLIDPIFTKQRLQFADIDKIQYLTTPIPLLPESYARIFRIYSTLAKVATAKSKHPLTFFSAMKLLTCRTFNAHSIGKNKANGQSLGFALVPGGSFFNHECIPTAACTFQNGWFTARALTCITKNQEIKIAYCRIDATREERQRTKVAQNNRFLLQNTMRATSFPSLTNFSTIQGFHAQAVSSVNDEETAAKKKTGIFKEIQVSGPLLRLTNGQSVITRQDLLKKVWEHIKAEDLQKDGDRRTIEAWRCPHLSELSNHEREFHMNSLQKYFQPFITKL